MKYTIGQAAKATGRSKSLISKAIKDGRLSATRQGNTPTSPMQIDASELFRVFPLVLKQENKLEQPEEQPERQSKNDAVALATALEILKFERRFQDEKIEDLKEQLREAKDRAEEYRQELRSSEIKLLGVMERVAASNTTNRRQGFWKRVFG